MDIHENRLQAAGRYSHVCRECWAVLKIAYYHTTRASIKHVYFVRVHFICINRKKISDYLLHLPKCAIYVQDGTNDRILKIPQCSVTHEYEIAAVILISFLIILTD